MKLIKSLILAVWLSFVASPLTHAQSVEGVYWLQSKDSGALTGAMSRLFEDKNMRGNKATLYWSFYNNGAAANFAVVADFDDHADHEKDNEARLNSAGWARFLLATQDTDLAGIALVKILDNYGKERHTTGYIAVYSLQVKDATIYRAALKKLLRVGNPGGINFVEIRAGGTGATHSVVIGAPGFVELNNYLDKLFASEEFAEFIATVGPIRKVVGTSMYKREGAWGY